MIGYVICSLICWLIGCYVGWSLERKEKDELTSLHERLYRDTTSRLTTAIKELATENNLLRKQIEEANNERKD